MDELLTEQQQAEQVKGWLRQNGFFLVAGVALGLAALFGWNQWNRYQERQAEAASNLYETFLTSVRGNRLEEAEAGLKTLAADHGSSPYADQARLAMARLYLDQSKPDQAADYLGQVASGATSPEMRLIGRLRLARVLIYQEKYEEALKQLADPGSGAFAPAFHEVRGDAYFAMGKMAEARSEYEQALNSEMTTNVIDRTYVEAKLDDAGGPTRVVAAPAADPAAPPPAP